MIQASWAWRHAWLRTKFGLPLCLLVAFQVGLRAHNKIFLNCLKFLFALLALRILKYYLAFKQYQYRWSSEDEVFPSALTVPGAHGGLAGWGEIWSGPARPPPLQRSRRWSPQVPRIGNSTIIIVLLCKQDCTPSRHYINFVFGLSQHSLLDLHLIKISTNILCLLLLVLGIKLWVTTWQQKLTNWPP